MNVPVNNFQLLKDIVKYYAINKVADAALVVIRHHL